MAKKSALAYVQEGYAQVEPNRLTAMVNGEMESQAPAIKGDGSGKGIELLENGMFLCIVADGAGVSPMGRIAVLPGGAGATDEAYLVFNERKVYDEREMARDYAMVADKFIDGLPFPRLFKITAGDVFTTNCIADDVVPAVGIPLYVGDDGYLTATPATNTSVRFLITKVYTMPDGEPGVKLVADNYR